MSTNAQKWFGEILSNPNYTLKEIKKHFRKLMHKYHPDVSPGTTQITQQIIDAYESISKNYTASKSANTDYKYSYSGSTNRRQSSHDQDDDFDDFYKSVKEKLRYFDKSRFSLKGLKQTKSIESNNV